MFGIGLPELLVIFAVVLLVFGPKRLPDLAKSLGKGIAEFRKASEEVRKGFEDAVKNDADKAAETNSPVPPPASPAAAIDPYSAAGQVTPPEDLGGTPAPGNAPGNASAPLPSEAPWAEKTARPEDPAPPASPRG